jgi:hypothetical protein
MFYNADVRILIINPSKLPLEIATGYFTDFIGYRMLKMVFAGNSSRQARRRWKMDRMPKSHCLVRGGANASTTTQMAKLRY